MKLALTLAALSVVFAGTVQADLPALPDPATLAREAASAYAGKDYERAAARYRLMVTSYPSLPGGRVGLARALAQLGRRDEALESLRLAADYGADAAAVSAAFQSAAGDGGPSLAKVLARFRANVEPIVRSSLVFRLAERDLMPESIALDPKTGTFYIGSLHRRKIVGVRGGVTEDFRRPRRTAWEPFSVSSSTPPCGPSG